MTDLYTGRDFRGHLGRLSQDQEKSLEDFKASLEKAGLYTPATDTEKASHDDATILRFLRARRWDIKKAQKQFQDWVTWRGQHDVDNLFANFPEDEFESSRRFYPRWTGRRDKQGLPIYVYRLAALTDEIYKELNSVPQHRRYQRVVVLYEAMVRFVSPLCSHIPHDISPTPITSITAIIDLEGVSFGKMWAFRNHLQEASTLANANYPETLGTVIVVGSPSYFSTVWNWIKGWFDEVTRKKIHILPKDKLDMIKTLIDPKDLPKAYGGELDWQFEDDPHLDDEIKNTIGSMPRGPVIFEDGEIKRPKEYKGQEAEPVQNGTVSEMAKGEQVNGIQTTTKEVNVSA